jgi:hypothetical protein
LLEPARYKGAYGGRGSGKSHFFGELMINKKWKQPGSSMMSSALWPMTNMAKTN